MASMAAARCVIPSADGHRRRPRRPEQAVIVISRTFDAPRAVVFEAFTRPEHIAQFWGPKGTTAPRCEVDLRVGGEFRVELRGPDGAIYPCTGIYREIAPPDRLVYAGTADDDNPCGAGLPPRSLVTMSFQRGGSGKTNVTVHAQLQSAADQAAAAIAGGFQRWLEASRRTRSAGG